MATFKHISSKNADYGAAEQYLTFEHDEFTMRPTLDETGRLVPREDYRLATLNCGGEDFAVACMRSNLRYGKNQKREDVKSHHYIISFDPRDGTDNGLTVDRAQELGERFCKAHFPGHQAIVCTHPDGHNHSGNTHVHIVINSLRIEEVPLLPYMDRPADTKAGCKHRCTDAAMEYFKAEVMEMCHWENLYQIDLLHGSKNRVTEREYWAQRKGQATLQNLFDRQYILTEEVEVEVRYRTETDTWTDEEGNTHTDTYQVPYDYYICYVTLENFNLSHVPIYMMSEEQLSRYALYMATLGNRPDLFPQSGYVPRYTNPPPKHDVPEAYLADETFAAILEEAEKYLGFPYVWGGSSPSTSFDCSGFVSYVYNQCGWDFGRLGAQGLYNISTPTNNPKPGDLVFFTGTYDTPGVSHVGIYVGDGWMLDCGDPIHYSNLNTNYWQSHFYAYGKLY